MEIYREHYAGLIDNSTACGSHLVSDLSQDNQKYRSSAYIKRYVASSPYICLIFIFENIAARDKSV